MKRSAKGPFKKIFWFCKDGSVLPPKPYACSKHGGGIQHGQWNDSILSLRNAGFRVGNVLAELLPEHFIGPDADLAGLKQILLERFLIAADDGWIFRGARSYRGALQFEDEAGASERLLLAMLDDPLWLTAPRFGLLRETVRLLPQKNRSPALSEMRLLSATIHDVDPDFAPIRAKIHAVPGLSDADLVREYARTQEKEAIQADYRRLAEVIDQVFSSKNTLVMFKTVIAKIRDPAFKQVLIHAQNQLKVLKKPEERLIFAGQIMVKIRDAIGKSQSHSALVRLGLLRVSIALEQEFFRVASSLLPRVSTASRRQQLLWLSSVAKAMYGTGFLYARHLQSIEESLDRLFKNGKPSVYDYRKELFYLARVIGWSDRTMAFLFKESQKHMAILEPLVDLYPQDRLRSSPLLFFGTVIDRLVMDANRLAHMEHRLFGRSVGAGIRALNPGLARGVLRISGADHIITDPHGIYLLPETTSDLTPVAGILTQGEGNALSHVQLLARNLAIPNAVIGSQWLPELTSHVGERVVMSVSSDGVMILEEDSPNWERFFVKTTESKPSDTLIRPDLEKLDLDNRDFISLTNLRAHDSGRIAGPKGANLGELKFLFGDTIPPGFVIPFGVFREFLEQPLEAGGISVFSWMKQSYTEIAALPVSAAMRQKKVVDFLGRLRLWIETSDPGLEFRNKLQLALQQHFGKDGSFGVFVRSDTNVEDLPGFTGAGLNHTVANVIGNDKIMHAIQKVWASPFTERAFAWRQAHMDQPQYVFPAVLVQYSFPSEKSGVMVTKDVLWGEPGWISIAVNEGVGGAVDGQAAESLRVNLTTGAVNFLAHATAPYRKESSIASGLRKVAASGSDRLLQDGEIQQLIQLAQDIPEKFSTLRDEKNQPMPADVEFAFRDGRLALLQIRPFVEAKNVRRLGFVSTANPSKFMPNDRGVVLDAIPDAIEK